MGLDPLGQDIPAEFSDEHWYKDLDIPRSAERVTSHTVT